MDARSLRDQTQQLLSGPLKQAKGAALAALLVPLAVAVAPDAAEAGVEVAPRSSRVDRTVTFQPGNNN
jgi:hypothetical protein